MVFAKHKTLNVFYLKCVYVLRLKIRGYHLCLYQ